MVDNHQVFHTSMAITKIQQNACMYYGVACDRPIAMKLQLHMSTCLYACMYLFIYDVIQ